MDRKPTKRPRVARACDRCFSKKDKCDGSQPQCQICAKLGAECSYNRPQLRRGPQAGIRNKLEGQVEMLESILGFLVIQVGDRQLSSLTNLLDLTVIAHTPDKDDDEPAPAPPGNIYPNSMTRLEASRVWNRSEMASLIAPALGLELKSDNGEPIPSVKAGTPATSTASSSSKNAKASTSKLEPDSRLPPRLSPEGGFGHHRQASGLTYASSPQGSFHSPMAPPPINSPSTSETMARPHFLSGPEARGSPQRIWERPALPSQGSNYGVANWASSPLNTSQTNAALHSPHSRSRRPAVGSFEDATNVSPELEGEMDMLLDTYFQNFHSIAPFVDRNAILRWSSETSAQGRRRVTTHGPPESPGRLALILAICSLSASRHQSWQQSSRAEHARLQALSDDCHARARMLFFDAEGGSVFEVGPSHTSPGGRADGPGDIEAVQAILLLAIADIMQDRTTRAWVGLGMAIRLAQDMGIDKEPVRHDGYDGGSDTPMQDVSTASTVEQHRRLTWWTLFNFDVIFSLALGRTPALRAAENTAARPDPAQSPEEWNLCAAHTARESSGRTSEGAGTTRKVKARAISTFNAQSMLCEILSTVCTETRLQKLQDVMPALHQWRNDLPEHLRAAIVGSTEPAALGGPTASTIPQPCHVWNLAMNYHFAFLVAERAVATARASPNNVILAQSATDGMWSPNWSGQQGIVDRGHAGKEDWQKVTISSATAQQALPRLLSRFVNAFGPLSLPPLGSYYILAAAHSLSIANDAKETPRLWESLCSIVNTAAFASPGIRRILRLLPILGQSNAALRPHRSSSFSNTTIAGSGGGSASPMARSEVHNQQVGLSPLEGMFMSPDPFAYDFGSGSNGGTSNSLGRDADAALSYALGLHVGSLDSSGQAKSGQTPSFGGQAHLGSGSGPLSSPRGQTGSTPLRWPNDRPSPASTTADMASSSLSEDGDASLARMYDVGISAMDHSNILYNLGLQPSMARSDSLAGVSAFLENNAEAGIPSPWALEAATSGGRPIQPPGATTAQPQRYQQMHQQQQQQQQHSVPPQWHAGNHFHISGSGNVGQGTTGPNSLVPNGADPNAALGGLDLDLDLDFTDVSDILDKWAHRGSEVL